MQEPSSPSAVGAEDHQAQPHGLDSTRPLSNLNPGSTIWRARDVMRPLVLSDTERRFRFRGLPQALRAARRALRGWGSHLEPEVFYDLSLCVGELVTNRVQQGEPARGGEIELAVWRSETVVRAEIREPPPGAAATQPSARTPEDWGMFILDRVADRWGVSRSAGTLVWCEIDLASDGRSRDRFVMGSSRSAPGE